MYTEKQIKEKLGAFSDLLFNISTYEVKKNNLDMIKEIKQEMRTLDRELVRITKRTQELEKALKKQEQLTKAITLYESWEKDYSDAYNTIHEYLIDNGYPLEIPLHTIWYDVLGYKGAYNRAIEIVPNIMDSFGYCRRPMPGGVMFCMK